jgi:glutathione synthase
MSALTSVFIIDPPDRLDPPTDTSLALMRESLNRGHLVFFCTLSDLRLEKDEPWARVRSVEFFPGRELFAAGEAVEFALGECDILHMRKDPPVDEAYLHATFLLDRLPERVLQVNPSRALRNHCEKLIPCHFPDLMPESVVTCDSAVLSAFLEKVGHMVVKPLEDCSGHGVFTLTRDDPDTFARCREATAGGGRYVQGQEFLPGITEGDKRVLLLGGEILGWLRRVPAAGDFRSNINAGGTCAPCELTESDRAICDRIGSWLTREGIHLGGVDIVGEKVLEVNITSPSCLREMNELAGTRLECRILGYLEALCPR